MAESKSPRKSGGTNNALSKQLTIKKQTSLIPSSLMKRMSTLSNNRVNQVEAIAAENLKIIKDSVDCVRGLK